jgi:starch phosphorylase
LCPSFNMQRVVKQYAAESYVTAHERYQRLTAEGSARAKALAAWVSRIRANWAQVRVERIAALAATELAVGSQIQVRAWIRLGAISPEEVAVELYLGRLDSGGEITGGVAIPMQPAGQSPEGLCIFEAAAVPCSRSGLHGYTVRVCPSTPTRPRPSCPDSSPGRMRSESRRRRNPLASEAARNRRCPDWHSLLLPSCRSRWRPNRRKSQPRAV